jgi:putative acetyltransferase
MSNITYFNAQTKANYDLTKVIFIEYQQYLKIDLCFQSFENELLNLDKIYAAPKGTIILAKFENKIVGCIALKPIEENNCEMKRLYVKPKYRGNGMGAELITKLLDFAKDNNYEIMKLDTLKTLNEAVTLYHRFGFIETPPYVFNPLDEVLYFEKKLI